MASVSARRSWLVCLLVLALLAAFERRAAAEPHFLGGFTTDTNTYYATAQMVVEIPTGYNTTTKSFTFTNAPTFSFDVVGRVRLWNDNTSDNYNDPYSGAYGTSGDSLNTLRLEIAKVTVNLADINSSPGASVTGIRIGDGVANGASNGPLYSTGGAREHVVDGPGSGYMNLYLQVDIDEPDLITPNTLKAAFPGVFENSYDLGTLSNAGFAHIPLQTEIGAFPPFGIVFSMPAGTKVNMYAPADHPFVQDLADPSLGPARRTASPMTFARFSVVNLMIVPEPSSYAIAGLAFVALVAFAVVKKRRSQAEAQLAYAVAERK